MNVIVFLLIAGASARHVLDVQFNSNDKNGDVIERRNIGYIGLNHENTPYVNSDFVQTNKVIRTKTNERFVESTETLYERNYEDSLNNINDNDNNDHRLRTNAYTTEAYSTTEYIVQDVNAFTNRKEQKYIAERNPVNRGVVVGQMDQKNTHKVASIQCNKPKSRSEIRPAINNNQGRRRPETSVNIPIQNPQNERTNIITNHSKEPVNVQETELIQPIPSEESREDPDRLPKTDTEEQIWVWETVETSTDPGSLDDRAAFTGDKCPTGKAKVKGICVEKH